MTHLKSKYLRMKPKFPDNHSLRWVVVVLAAMLFTLSFSSCDRSRMDKGYEYFPDMAHGHDYKTYEEVSHLPDGSIMLLPPEGTVPTDADIYTLDNSYEARVLAGQTLVNPFQASEANLERGKELYEIFCMNCHGSNGAGDGILFTSGRYAIKPASLVSDSLKFKPTGEIFHVISAGWGVMGAHAQLIKPDDRWKIVAFIENVLQEK